jgi:hypothetical protein
MCDIRKMETVSVGYVAVFKNSLIGPGPRTQMSLCMASARAPLLGLTTEQPS